LIGQRSARGTASQPNADKRVAVVLTNHNAKAARIANAVGPDSPASLLHLLHSMRPAGYDVGDALPPDSDTLMATSSSAATTTWIS